MPRNTFRTKSRVRRSSSRGTLTLRVTGLWYKTSKRYTVSKVRRYYSKGVRRLKAGLQHPTSAHVENRHDCRSRLDRRLDRSGAARAEVGRASDRHWPSAASLRKAKQIGAVSETTLSLERRRRRGRFGRCLHADRSDRRAGPRRPLPPAGRHTHHRRRQHEGRRSSPAWTGNFRDGIRFVGSHPLAGSEKSGPAAATADLFDGRVVVVTPCRTTRDRRGGGCGRFLVGPRGDRLHDDVPRNTTQRWPPRAICRICRRRSWPARRRASDLPLTRDRLARYDSHRRRRPRAVDADFSG